MASDNKPAVDSATGGAGLLVQLRSIFKGVGLLVLLLAITVGMVGKVDSSLKNFQHSCKNSSTHAHTRTHLTCSGQVTPELLLKVPNIGFILWAISGFLNHPTRTRLGCCGLFLALKCMR